MTTPNARRQAAYRARHFHSIDGELERLNLALSVSANAQLLRLARHYGVTLRETIERLAAEAEGEAVALMTTSEQRRYFDGE